MRLKKVIDNMLEPLTFVLVKQLKNINYDNHRIYTSC